MGLIRPVSVIALYALLLPLFGPLLDHHFVEWQHNHAHLYLDGRSADGAAAHRHIYERSGGHWHRPAAPDDGKTRPAAAVAYLTAGDGVGTVAAGLALTAAVPAMLFPDAGDNPRLGGYASAERMPPGALVMPPRKPPRS